MLRLVLLVGVPIAVVIGGAFIWQQGGRYVSTENAYVKADIAQIAPEVAGRVIQVAVHDHEHVTRGTPLVQLDPEPYRLALAQAEAELELARHQVETARATYRETASEMAEVESRAAYQARQLQRQESLAGSGVVSASRLEEAQNDAAVARERLNVVRRRMERMLTILGGNAAIPRDQHPWVREKLAARDRAALDLERTTIKAPLDGIAVNVKLQVGEQVKAATPLFVLVSDKRPWVEANLKETTLTHVKVGQKATVVLDIYPDVVWDGVVQSISPAAGSEFAILPPQNASGNWVKVVQRLPVKVALLPHSGEPPLRAGMTATVDIDTMRQRDLGAMISSWFNLGGGAKAARREGAVSPAAK
ncbi:MAG: efflux RND transporter periplasmic adaptor subunit [Acetobacteraceae bacterium]